MIQLSSNATKAFLKRFGDLHDAIVRSVAVSFRSASQPTTVELTISTKDSERPDDDGWINLHLMFVDAPEFSFNEDQKSNSHHVIFEAVLDCFDGLFFLNLDNSELDLTTRLGYRESQFYVTGHSLEWEVLPYAE